MADGPILVMLIDDHPDELGMIAEAIGQAGLTALPVLSGEAALALLDHTMPDLVVMDAVMPGLDGFETCRRIKAQPRLAHMPVIFMTGLKEPENVLQGLSAGGVDYVAKPVNLPELLARIRIHVANGRIALGARMALDITGRTLLAADRQGRVRWSTPQAADLLAGAFPVPGERGFLLPDSALRALTGAIQRQAADPGRAQEMPLAEGIGATYLGANGPDEHLFRLSGPAAQSDQDILREAMQLTEREAEVLLWLARGKANREISEILTISPRTVNKHLERIFDKLGVENRSAATSVAMATIAARR